MWYVSVFVSLWHFNFFGCFESFLSHKMNSNAFEFWTMLLGSFKIFVVLVLIRHYLGVGVGSELDLAYLTWVLWRRPRSIVSFGIWFDLGILSHTHLHTYVVIYIFGDIPTPTPLPVLRSVSPNSKIYMRKNLTPGCAAVLDTCTRILAT